MALTNALFAGLSGMDVSQIRLNVVGNNIANANTVAFKATRVAIKPQFYVTDSAGSQPQGDSGGTNPIQRGLGASMASLDRNFAQGTIESTGRNTDLALDGDGFFIVKAGETRYTRDGTFRLNSANQLVTSAGYYVQGYTVDANFNLVTTQLSNLTIPLGTAVVAQATSAAALEGNLDASGQPATGASILNSQALTTTSLTAPTELTLLTDLASADNPTEALFAAGDAFTLSARKGGRNLPSASFTVGSTSTLGDLMTFLRQALGINTSVPDDNNPTTPAPGVSIVADPANPTTARLVITGNTGAGNALSLPPGSFVSSAGASPLAFADGTDADGISSDPTGASAYSSFVVYDSLGAPVTLAVTSVLESTSATGSRWRFYVELPSATGADRAVGTGTLTFDSYGRLVASTGTTVAIPRTGTGAASPLTISLDFSRITALASDGSTMVMTSQDGTPPGSLTGFSVGTDGIITGTFSNGATRTLGRIAIATFSNVQGLMDRGGNMFVEGANSGPAVIGVPGELGAGRIVAGALENSNVDLSEEFINLIIASTGFTAASRVISASDQLLNELLNTSR